MEKNENILIWNTILWFITIHFIQMGFDIYATYVTHYAGMHECV